MFKSLRLRPMTYESLHSKSCGGGLCFVRQRKKGMRALVLGGLLAVMCVCLLKADLIYIYIHRQWASTLSKTLVLSMTPPQKGPNRGQLHSSLSARQRSRCRKCASPLIGLLGAVDAQKSPMESPSCPMCCDLAIRFPRNASQSATNTTRPTWLAAGPTLSTRKNENWDSRLDLQSRKRIIKKIVPCMSHLQFDV
jgi:hypothetical protein